MEKIRTFAGSTISSVRPYDLLSPRAAGCGFAGFQGPSLRSAFASGGGTQDGVAFRAVGAVAHWRAVAQARRQIVHALTGVVGRCPRRWHSASGHRRAYDGKFKPHREVFDRAGNGQPGRPIQPAARRFRAGHGRRKHAPAPHHGQERYTRPQANSSPKASGNLLEDVSRRLLRRVSPPTLYWAIYRPPRCHAAPRERISACFARRLSGFMVSVCLERRAERRGLLDNGAGIFEERFAWANAAPFEVKIFCKIEKRG